MTPNRLHLAGILSLAMAVPTVPAFASVTPDFANGIGGMTAAADSFRIDVKQGRSGTGERGRDRDRDDDDHNDDRGRGRGGDDSRNDDSGSRGGDDGSVSGRDETRIPGGSGCDSPRDLLEHPECGGGIGSIPTDGALSGSGRDKPRIPGGSGCDDPEDLLEHPECRL